MADTSKLVADLRIERDSAGRLIAARLTTPDKILEPVIDKKIRFQAALDSKIFASTAIARTMRGLRVDLDRLIGDVRPALPTRLRGWLVAPDGKPGARLVVEVLPPAPDLAWSVPRGVTDDAGRFNLRLPNGPLPSAGLTVRVRGGNRTGLVKVRRVDAERGDAGLIVLEAQFDPQESLLERLADLLPGAVEDVDDDPGEYSAPLPPILFSQEDECARAFQSSSGVIDRFSYSMLIRLVEPIIGPGQVIFTFPAPPTGGRPVRIANPLTAHPIGVNGSVVLKFWEEEGIFAPLARAALGQPLDVAGFQQDAAFSPADVPKAASLALGYVVRMRQVWVPSGLSLGDLVYSLPLAPGEEQRIVIVEQDERLDVLEREGIAFEERQSFREATDVSTSSLFDSALKQMAEGSSRVESTSHSGGIGLVGAIGTVVGPGLLGAGLGAGFSGSSSSGSSTTDQNSSRDFVSTAAQDLHSTLSRTATFTRRARRTSVRQATATDRTTVASKRIANHNHCHALTIQYFEVLRHYAVVSEVEDVQLVCFVPLDLVPFCASGQEGWCVEGLAALGRGALLERYRYLLRYWDLLWAQVRRDPTLRAGLDLLKSFAADPSMQVEPANAPAQNVVDVAMTGTFMPFETVTVTVVSRNGRTTGPVTLLPTAPIPEIKVGDFETIDAYYDALRTARADRSTRISASIALPPDVRRNDVVRFDFQRRFRRVSGTLKLPEAILEGLALPVTDTLSAIQHQNFVRLAKELLAQLRVRISPARLERQIEGPFVWDLDARLAATSDAYVDVFNGQAARVLMLQSMPVTARRLAPLLGFEDLIRIEAVYQHVAQNAVPFSRKVWSSLSQEERVMMLEPYTIGFPDGGADDIEQQIPLLNCISNQVLGYYGNSYVMPFFVPPNLAEARGMTTRDLQEAIIRFHRESFVAPQTSITLPTHGVLGEAVLGSCNSCEKIDLTRFWNWQDSPPLAPGDAGVAPPKAVIGQQIAADTVEAPSALAPLASKINVIGSITQAAPGLNPAVIAALAAKGAETKTGAPDTIAGIGTAAALAKKSALLAQTGLANLLTDASKMAEAALENLPNTRRADAGLAPLTKAADKPAADAAAAAAADPKVAAAAAAAAAAKPATPATPGATPPATPSPATTPVGKFVEKSAAFVALVALAANKAAASQTVIDELGIDVGALNIEQKAVLALSLADGEKDTQPTKDAKTALRTVLGLGG